MKIIAAFIFFTRLPLWRMVRVPPEYFKNIIPYWAITGWITAIVSASVLWTASLVLPASVAVLLAMAARLLLTGALHEDGLADFFDGFGGGGAQKERILAIMKDSHMGSYGVISLIIYFLLYYSLLLALPLQIAVCTLLAADPCAKFIASLVVNRLPYARPEAQSKTKITYDKTAAGGLIFALIAGIVPLVVLFPPLYLSAVVLPLLLFFVMCAGLKKRIGGYTGDCCGALFLMCELTIIIGISIIYNCYGIVSC